LQIQGGRKSGHGPPSSLAIDVGPSNEEINMRYWETLNSPLAECLDLPHDVAHLAECLDPPHDVARLAECLEPPHDVARLAECLDPPLFKGALDLS